MAEYIKRVPFEALIEHLNKKEPCKNCYHLAACDAWVRNATTLYDDYSYSVKNCPYYKPAADVVKVVRCEDCKHLTIHTFPTLYEYCEKTHYRFESFKTDTRTHFCGFGELKEREGE